MNFFNVSKVIPNAIDIVLFIFIAFSVYFKNYPITSYILLAIPCLAMNFMIFRQIADCYKQKSVYNFTMLVTAVQTKADCSTKVIRDLIIYGLHIYLYTLNPKAIYLVSFGMCLVYDLMIYNAAFNPFMKKYVFNQTMNIVEENQNKEAEK